MLRFDVGKRLGKCVGDHVIGRTINEINGTVIDDESNKMIPDVNMLCASVIRTVTGECDGGL